MEQTVLSAYGSTAEAHYLRASVYYECPRSFREEGKVELGLEGGTPLRRANFTKPDGLVVGSLGLDRFVQRALVVSLAPGKDTVMAETANHLTGAPNSGLDNRTDPAVEAVQTEHRLAVVMNGGVSLAVWMGGVAYELDNLRRASHGMPAPEESAQHVYGHWANACAAQNTAVTVDVIAGTSAGGLNGVLLAAAIARGAPLAHLRSLWGEAGQASVDKLLRPQETGTRSLFNGDFFHEEIIKAIDFMTPNVGDARDVDLTVMSTALNGDPRRVYDSYGRPFNQDDHRRRFRFRRTTKTTLYRGGAGPGEFTEGAGVDDFTSSEPLGTAARASASYPGAFVPVLESPELASKRSWPTWPTGDKPVWLADGGILDNSPFEPVLQAIAAQPVSAAWKRTLCYVVPSADEAAVGREVEAAAAAAKDEIQKATAAGTRLGELPVPLPPPWTAVVAAALGFPREADFRDDIEQLHISLRGGRASLDVARFELLLDGTRPEYLLEGITISSTALPLYREAQAATAVYWLRDLVASTQPAGYLDPAAVVDPAPIAHPREWLPANFPDGLLDEWNWGADAADRVTRLMLRALRGAPASYNTLRATLSRHIANIGAIRSQIDDRLSKTPAPQGRPISANQAAEAIDFIYTSLGLTDALARVVKDAATDFARGWLEKRERASDVLLAALCVETANGVGATPAAPKAGPIFDFARIGISRSPNLLSRAYSDADTKLKARAEAQGGNEATLDANDILYGTRLSHFAAFGRPEWRSWDWMWGRLHAVTQIGDVLGLSSTQIDQLTEAVIKSEGRTVDGVKAEIPVALLKTSGELIGDLREESILSPVLDAVFDLLGTDAKTFPPLPHPVAFVGRLASDLLSRRPGKMSTHRGVARRALDLLNVTDRLWRKTEVSDSD